MSEKIHLPKEVAEAIDYFKNGTDLDYPEQAIMKVAMEDVRYIGDPDYCDDIKEFVKSNDNLKLLMSALVNGYEIEKTPEDMVQSMYEEAKHFSVHGQESSAWWQGRLEGIEGVLTVLGIKIPGVNAE